MFHTPAGKVKSIYASRFVENQHEPPSKVSPGVREFRGGQILPTLQAP